MATLKSRWLDWQPPTTTSVAEDPSSEPHTSEKRTDKTDKRYPSGPNTSEKRTDKTDKSPSVSFVSAVSGHIAADEDQGAGTWDAADWQALYNERASIREYDGELPRNAAERQALADTVDHWLVQHPPGPTEEQDGCNHCSNPLDDDAIPVLAGDRGHVWLHGRCHPPWLAGRRRQAAEALQAMGIEVTG